MLNTLLILSVIYNNVLYISRPPNSKFAYITFDDNNKNISVSWHQMQNESSIDNVRFFKINCTNIISNNSTTNILNFKVNYIYKNRTKTSNWQSVVYNHTDKNYNKNSVNYNTLGWVLLLNSYMWLIIYIMTIAYVIKKKITMNKYKTRTGI